MIVSKKLINKLDVSSTLKMAAPNLKSLVTFSHALAGIRTQAVVRDNVQYFQARREHVEISSVALKGRVVKYSVG